MGEREEPLITDENIASSRALRESIGGWAIEGVSAAIPIGGSYLVRAESGIDHTTMELIDGDGQVVERLVMPDRTLDIDM